MPWTIEKTWTFDSAHRLPRVPPGHKCGRTHGHTYRVTVRLRSDRLLSGEDEGMVYEYGKLAERVTPLVEQLDHRTINEVKGLENPTTEVLAAWFYEHLRVTVPFLAAIVVQESSTTSCTYEP